LPANMDTIKADRENPYVTAVVAEESPEKGGAGKKEPSWWRTVLVRWEMMRPLFNLIVGLAGLAALAPYLGQVFHPVPLIGALVYAIVANIAYLLGPFFNLYLAFIGLRQRWVAIVIFSLGTFVSVVITVGLAMTAGPPLFENLAM